MTRKSAIWIVIACLGVLPGALPHAAAQQKIEEFERPVDHYAYAQGLFKGKLYDFALKAFQEFVAAYPKHELVPSAHANMISCYRKLERHDDMLKAIEEFRRRWPKNSNAEVVLYWAGESYLGRGMLDKAKECFELLLKSENEHLKEFSTYLLARALAVENAKNERIYDLYAVVAAMDFKPDRPFREQAAFDLAKHRQLQLKYGDALTLYTRLGAYKEGREALREEALYSIGEIYFAQHDYARAHQAYDHFLTLFPQGKWSNEVRKRRAEATFQQRDISASLKMVLEWRAMNPTAEDFEMDCLHGRCLYQMNEFATAWPHFEAVVKNGKAPVEMRRYCLYFGIHCLLEDDKKASWERGLELCQLYFSAYADASLENKVKECKGRLLENLGRYAEAIATYEVTLREMGKDEASRNRQLRLRMAQCRQALKQFAQAAALLRALAGEPGCQDSRLKYMLAAADLSQQDDKLGEWAEKDLLTALGYKEIPQDTAEKCHERLSGIYLERKDYKKAHEQIAMLLKTLKGEAHVHYLYRDAWVLTELKQQDAAVACLKAALSEMKARNETLEVNIRLLLLTIYQRQYKEGKAEAADGMVEQYTYLADKPLKMTAGTLNSSVLYQIATLLAKKYEKTKNAVDRRLLERTYERAIEIGGSDAAALFAGYRLAQLYMQRGDGRYRLADKVLARVTSTVMTYLGDKTSHDAVLKQLGNAENFLREALALQCVCCYSLRRDTEAMALADLVLKNGLSYTAAKRCLLVQARIYYGRSPQNLDMALRKLADYQYILSDEPGMAEEEEDAMVLMVKVQYDMLKLDKSKQRLESAQEAYRQLRFRYPERLKREPWIGGFEEKYVPKDGAGKKQNP